MEILLPPQRDGKQIKVPANTRQLTIIGANGSGKTRFTDHLIGSLGDKAYRISALSALYGCRPAEQKAGSIDALYSEASASPAFLHNEASTTFERLFALLLNEEIANLVEYKMRIATEPEAKPDSTKLDAVVAQWQQIFPGNHVMRQGGRLLFKRDDTCDDAYSQVRLSDGEKTVLYYLGAVLYAPCNAVVFVDNPGIFLHPSIIHSLWDTIEEMRQDCTFIYTTHDLDFASTRTANRIVWVRRYDAGTSTWDYDFLPANSGLSDDIYMEIIGARKPVLFIEGDSTHSIDAKLYPLIFTDYTVKSLGSCNKVIEATRTFNDLNTFHHLDSHGIVDRDRRDDGEVKYLREKKIFVPNVAEIENILMLEEVVRTVAHRHGVNEAEAARKVKSAVIAQFKGDLRQQALLHTRHRVKRTMEYRIDGRFTNINMLEDHMVDLVNEINPRGLYESFCREFHGYVDRGDYQSVLRVYNQKSMIVSSNVAGTCGVRGGKDDYIKAVLNILKENGRDAARMRRAIKQCFGIDDNNNQQGAKQQ